MLGLLPISKTVRKNFWKLISYFLLEIKLKPAYLVSSVLRNKMLTPGNEIFKNTLLNFLLYPDHALSLVPRYLYTSYPA